MRKYGQTAGHRGSQLLFLWWKELLLLCEDMLPEGLALRFPLLPARVSKVARHARMSGAHSFHGALTEEERMPYNKLLYQPFCEYAGTLPELRDLKLCGFLQSRSSWLLPFATLHASLR